MTRVMRASFLSISLLAACAGDPAGQPAGDGAGGGKADDLACAGAHLDGAGVCRSDNGRFAPKACCEASTECEIVEDQAFDVCVPDDDAPAHWPSCWEALAVDPSLPVACCNDDADAYLWCGQMAGCSSDIASPFGDDIEDVAEAQAGSVFITSADVDGVDPAVAAQVVAAARYLGLVGVRGTLADAVAASDDGIAVVDLELEGETFIAADWIDLRVGGASRGVILEDGGTRRLAQLEGTHVLGCE